jgi:hypothetical protein
MDEIRKIVPVLPNEGGTEKKLAGQSLCSAHLPLYTAVEARYFCVGQMLGTSCAAACSLCAVVLMMMSFICSCRNKI